MSDVIKAAFSLQDYRICKFSLDLDQNPKNEGIDISFDPEGIFHSKTKIFELILDFRAFKNPESKESPYLNARIHAFFQFENVSTLKEVPDFFYRNSVAIIFPYLRSFVSTLCLQANLNVLILPTLNLTSLEAPLLKNTKEQE